MWKHEGMSLTRSWTQCAALVCSDDECVDSVAVITDSSLFPAVCILSTLIHYVDFEIVRLNIDIYFTTFNF